MSNEILNVLGLFNGMNFGRMALESLNIKVGKYFSSEIDKYANQASQALFPGTIQLGDVTQWQDWEFMNIGFNLGDIDLLLAGFPCQAWSMAGKMKGDDDPRGALVHDLINIWKQINLCRAAVGKEPVKFMFENVKMKKEFLYYINDLFGVEPIFINSSLVSAQDRERYYWTNIKKGTKPADKRINIKDIITKDNIVKVSHRMSSDSKSAKAKIKGNCRNISGKHKTLLTGGIRPTALGGCHFKISDDWFQFLPEGAAKLQTVPDRHINTLLNAGISNSQLYKMIGNGWTHDVITHIFKGLVSA